MTITAQFYQALLAHASIEHIIQEDMKLHVSYPINELCGSAQIKEKFWRPLHNSLKDIERKAFIEFQSEYKNHTWSASTGYFVGTFTQDLLNIPATGKILYVRFTELVKLKDNKIADYYILIDFLDVMNQVGVNPLRKSLGHEGLIMPPSSMDGINPSQISVQHTVESEQLVMGMLEELGRFDGKSLTSMKLEEYWHPDFMWYGPAGIGTTRGIESFRQNHQGPFVFSFPDRVVDHKATIVKQGNYVSTGGWPHMHGSHIVGGWLGLPPTNKNLELRVIDIWRREGSLLRENWVAIDIIHICKQMGLDVFAMMESAYK